MNNQISYALDDSQIIETHIAIEDVLDDLLGNKFAEKSEGIYTGNYRRKGEGKFYKRILKFHEKQSKRYAQRLSFDDSGIYLFAFSHTGKDDNLATINCFNWPNASFRLLPVTVFYEEVKSYYDDLLQSMESHASDTRPMYLVTNMDCSLDSLSMFNEIFGF